MKFLLSSLIIWDVKKKKIRIGKENDGGYIILDGFNYDIFIGCGIGNDDSFENDFLDKYSNLKCLAYDGTVDKLPNKRQDNRIILIKKNISSQNTENTTNLHDIINKYNNIFLKMDIENNEYEWIESLTLSQLSKITQIVIEWHWPHHGDKWKYIKKINETHYLVHLHGNNCGKIINAGVNNVPSVFECTYINKKYVSNPTLNTIKIPSDIDMKNNINKEEIFLDGYPYTV